MKLKKLLCFLKHDWEFAGGYWVIKGAIAITKRSCQRCGLYEEVSQDHVNGIRFLEKQEIRNPPVPAKYPRRVTT